jgi:hypothetical protein
MGCHDKVSILLVSYSASNCHLVHEGSNSEFGDQEMNDMSRAVTLDEIEGYSEYHVSTENSENHIKA